MPADTPTPPRRSAHRGIIAISIVLGLALTVLLGHAVSKAELLMARRPVAAPPAVRHVPTPVVVEPAADPPRRQDL